MTDPVALERTGLNRWLVVITTCLACYVVGWNTTAVMTALPDIKADLNLGDVAGQWIVNIYMLGVASLVVIMGRFADIFGKLSIFAAGIILFATGSICIMAAEDVVLVMIGRVGQGVGAAALMASSVALIQVTTAEKDRSFAIGIWAGVIAFALGAGPLMGGFLTELVTWRAIFACDVLALAAVALLFVCVKSLGLVTPQLHPNERVDYLGAALFVAALGPLVYALSAGEAIGWTSVQILSLFAVALVAGAVFVVQELRVSVPLIHFKFFRFRRYRAATVGMFIDGLALIAALYFLNLYIQSPGGLDMLAYSAGAALLPFSAPYFLLSVTLPHWIGNTTLRWPIAAGLVLIAVGFWFLAQTTEQMTYGDIWWRLGLVGFGMGLTFPLLPAVGLRPLADENAGQGSGVINMCFYLGISCGLAAGSAIAGHIREYAVRATVAGFSQTPANSETLIDRISHGSASQAKQALAQFPAGEASKIDHTLNTIGASALSGVMVAFAIAAIVAAVVCFWLLRDAPKAAGER